MNFAAAERRYYEPDQIECVCENHDCTCEQDAEAARHDALIERADSIRKGEW